MPGILNMYFEEKIVEERIENENKNKELIKCKDK